MEFKVRHHAKVIGIFSALLISGQAFATGNQNPKTDPHNIYKYLKDVNGNCIITTNGCLTRNKSAKQLSPGEGFIGVNYSQKPSDPLEIQLDPNETNAGQGDLDIPKYSGALGTYTAFHYPIAIESNAKQDGNNKGRYTFFVYSGALLAYDDDIGSEYIGTTAGGGETTNPSHFLNGGDKSPALGIYVARYDNQTQEVSKPLLVHAKNTDDPHDNAVINRDDDDNLYIFVSGRNNKRGAFFYKLSPGQGSSVHSAFNDSNWEITDLGIKNINFATDPAVYINPNKPTYVVNDYAGMTYPKLFWTGNNSFRLLFNVYCNAYSYVSCYNNKQTRQLWTAKLDTSGNFTDIKMISAVGGHYAVANSTPDGKGIMIAFNKHPNGDVDKRTNMHVLYSLDAGDTWYRPNGDIENNLPYVNEGDLDAAEVVNYDSKNPSRYVYVKDLHLAGSNNPSSLDDLKPAILFVRSIARTPLLDVDNDGNGDFDEHQMNITFRDNGNWYTREITDLIDHNFSSGSLYWLSNNKYRVFYPGISDQAGSFASGYTNALAGGVFSHVDVTFVGNQISNNNHKIWPQKEPRVAGYLTGLCELNYIRTVHHGSTGNPFTAVMAAANPQRFEPMLSPLDLPAAPMYVTNPSGTLTRLPLRVTSDSNTLSTVSEGHLVCNH